MRAPRFFAQFFLEPDSIQRQQQAVYRMLLNTDFPTFQRHFVHQLREMLSPDALGAFILVLANSLQDKNLQADLREPLQAIFADLQRRFSQQALSAAEDDMTVFAALHSTGISHFTAWELRQIHHWQCAYNPLRALRPARSSSAPFRGLDLPFDEQGFHFDKPFLRKEMFCEENFHGTPLRILYHKFPFVPFHLLLLPWPTAHKVQLLEQETHELAWEVVHSVSRQLPGFGLAYNSLGAGASVNHLHLHGFVQPTPFAIESQDWAHHQGDQQYPLDCHFIASANDSWAVLEALHRERQPYNLLYRPGGCYVIPRPPQGTYVLPQWMQTAVWNELVGTFNLDDKKAFEQLTNNEIVAALKLHRIHSCPI